MGVAAVSAAAASAATVLPGSVGAQRVQAPGATSQPDPAVQPSRLAAHQLATAGRDVRAFFGELNEGTQLGHWRLEALYDVRAGGIPLVLSTQSGQRFAVEVFRLGEGPAPLATAGPVALYLINRGDGASASDEAAGLGVIALGRALEARVAAGAQVPSSLTTLAARRRAHPTGVFHVPVGSTD